MTTKTIAQRIADDLVTRNHGGLDWTAAAELRRLEAEVQALRGAVPAVPAGWVLIATDAYEAGFGKGLQAKERGKEIQNPWGDEPGREAWEIGYSIGKERAAAPQPAAQQEPDDLPVGVVVATRWNADGVTTRYEAAFRPSAGVKAGDMLYTRPAVRLSDVTTDEIEALADKLGWVLDPQEAVDLVHFCTQLLAEREHKIGGAE
jgi:hypothetical protein